MRTSGSKWYISALEIVIQLQLADKCGAIDCRADSIKGIWHFLCQDL